ncbi:lasso RiPP family leader peptide-containing protein [Halomonas sp. A29]|uniref:lasso RiPP family leader peptide-containing protein n=1 Tax=Halomonas sp. A29 TaxID=3102786 RepID=UPI00398A511A
MENTQEVKGDVRREYNSPQLIKWGTVADLTLMGRGRGRDGGSVSKPGFRKPWSRRR